MAMRTVLMKHRIILITITPRRTEARTLMTMMVVGETQYQLNCFARSLRNWCRSWDITGIFVSAPPPMRFPLGDNERKYERTY